MSRKLSAKRNRDNKKAILQYLKSSNSFLIRFLNKRCLQH